MEHFKLHTARGGEIAHDAPKCLHVEVEVVQVGFLSPPVNGVVAGSVATGLRHGAAAIPVDDLQLGLLITVVVAVECLLPGRSQVLYGGLGVVVAGQDVEHVWPLPAHLCQPVLVPQGQVELVLTDQPVHLLHLEVVEVVLAGPHVVQPVQHHAGVESL